MARFTDYQIVPAVAGHIPGLAANMREADRRELWAMARLDPETALWISLNRSVKAYAALTGAGETIQMWGVSRHGGLLGFVGSPWLLGSKILDRPEVSREYIRQSRVYARELEAGFRRLENWVHAENRLAIRWLRWLGYSLAPAPIQVNGDSFYHFWKEGQMISTNSCGGRVCRGGLNSLGKVSRRAATSAPCQGGD